MPEDYTAMTNMLSQHLKSKLMISVKDEEVSQTEDEEEKSSVQSGNTKDFIESCKEQIQKLKILD